MQNGTIIDSYFKQSTCISIIPRPNIHNQSQSQSQTHNVIDTDVLETDRDFISSTDILTNSPKNIPALASTEILQGYIELPLPSQSLSSEQDKNQNELSQTSTLIETKNITDHINIDINDNIHVDVKICVDVNDNDKICVDINDNDKIRVDINDNDKISIDVNDNDKISVDVNDKISAEVAINSKEIGKEEMTKLFEDANKILKNMMNELVDGVMKAITDVSKRTVFELKTKEKQDNQDIQYTQDNQDIQYMQDIQDIQYTQDNQDIQYTQDTQDVKDHKCSTCNGLNSCPCNDIHRLKVTSGRPTPVQQNKKIHFCKSCESTGMTEICVPKSQRLEEIKDEFRKRGVSLDILCRIYEEAVRACKIDIDICKSNKSNKSNKSSILKQFSQKILSLDFYVPFDLASILDQIYFNCYDSTCLWYEFEHPQIGKIINWKLIDPINSNEKISKRGYFVIDHGLLTMSIGIAQKRILNNMKMRSFTKKNHAYFHHLTKNSFCDDNICYNTCGLLESLDYELTELEQSKSVKRWKCRNGRNNKATKTTKTTKTKTIKTTKTTRTTRTTKNNKNNKNTNTYI
jgi:hypothetical protein